MRSEVSAFIDGALDDDSSRRVLEGLGRDAGLRAAWDDYCLVGDLMRRSGAMTGDFTARVMRRIDDEPTVLAPAAAPRRAVPSRPLWAVAASVAAVSTVAWMGLEAGRKEPAEAVAVRPAVQVAASNLIAAPAAGARIDRTPEAAVPPPSGAVIPYLIVHQGYGSAGGMQGVAQYVRAVSDTRQDAAR